MLSQEAIEAETLAGEFFALCQQEQSSFDENIGAFGTRPGESSEKIPS